MAHAQAHAPVDCLGVVRDMLAERAADEPARRSVLVDVLIRLARAEAEASALAAMAAKRGG